MPYEWKDIANSPTCLGFSKSPLSSRERAGVRG